VQFAAFQIFGSARIEPSSGPLSSLSPRSNPRYGSDYRRSRPIPPTASCLPDLDTDIGPARAAATLRSAIRAVRRTSCRAGSANAPFGYRYITVHDGGGAGRHCSEDLRTGRARKVLARRSSPASSKFNEITATGKHVWSRQTVCNMRQLFVYRNAPVVWDWQA
jgi:hypothetical protein